jgi:hypothetical protein
MYSLLFMMCSTLSLQAMHNSETPSRPPAPYITIYAGSSAVAEGQFSPTFDHKSDVYHRNIQNAIQTTQNSPTFITRFFDTARSTLSAVPATCTSVYDFLWSHKWSTAGALILGMYGIVATYFFVEKSFMYSTNLWARWYDSVSLAELCTLPPDGLRKELILAIHTRYVNSANPTDHVTPLSTFLYDIDVEEKRLKKFSTRARFISKMGLRKILPFSEETMREAERLLNRVAFVRHLFLSWAAEHNWQHTETVYQETVLLGDGNINRRRITKTYII